jgi:nitrite reductase/ring-hydroxylating ferredoxin subunit
MDEPVAETRLAIGGLLPCQAVKARHKFSNNDRPQHIFLVKTPNGNIRGYYNICPHMRAILDAGKGTFFDESNALLTCKVHGALFEPETGLCVEGPCAGEALTPVDFRIEGDEAIII